MIFLWVCTCIWLQIHSWRMKLSISLPPGKQTEKGRAGFSHYPFSSLLFGRDLLFRTTSKILSSWLFASLVSLSLTSHPHLHDPSHTLVSEELMFWAFSYYPETGAQYHFKHILKQVCDQCWHNQKDRNLSFPELNIELYMIKQTVFSTIYSA